MGGGSAETGFQNNLSHETSDVKGSGESFRLQKQNKTSGSKGPDSRAVTKTSYRNRGLASIRRVLQSHIPAPKEIRGMETYPRSKKAESLHSVIEIQNGNSQVNSRCAASKSLGVLHRPKRRLFPHPHPSPFSEISENSVRGTSISIPSITIRSEPSTMDFHQNSQTGEKHGTYSGTRTVPIPRRLARPSSLFTDRNQTSNLSGSPLSRTRFGSQPTEVRTDSENDLHLYRGRLQPHNFHHTSYRGEHSQSSGSGPSFQTEKPGHSSGMATVNRVTSESREISGVGKMASETLSMGPQQPMEPGQGRPECPDRHFSGYPGHSGMVDRYGTPQEGCPHQTFRPYSEGFHRCIYPGLGWTCGWPTVPGSLEWQREISTHQPAGNEGSTADTSRIGPHTAFCHSSGIRQLVCSCLHQQAGRHAVQGTATRDGPPAQLGHDQKMDNSSQTYPREIECHSRSAVSSGTDHPDRVVPSPGNSQSAVSKMVTTSDRPVCHQVQSQMPVVCEPSTGSQRNGGGRTLHQLGSPDSVCLPPHSDIGTSDHKDQQVQRMQNHPSGTSVGETIVVPPTEGTDIRRTDQVTLLDQNAQATQVRHLSPRPDHAQSSRLDIGKRALIREGYDADIADLIVAPQAASTLDSYQKKWECFANFCRSQDIVPEDASVPQITKFLKHLFHEDGLNPNTINIYKTAITSTLRFHRQLDYGRDPHLTNLMKKFRRLKPKSGSSLPPWDLQTVLYALQKPPFEPIADGNLVSLKHLTWKTVFLTLLASGARRGEIHALNGSKFKHHPGWRFVTLETHPDFISKTQLRKPDMRALQPFVIQSLGQFVGPDLPEDRKLCPVRCLKAYRARTAHIREQQKYLFISYRTNFK